MPTKKQEEINLRDILKLSDEELAKVQIHLTVFSFEHLIDNDYRRLDRIIKNGNFVISRPAFNLLKEQVKGRSMWHIFEKDTNTEVQKRLIHIEHAMPDKIVDASGADIYNEAIKLGPLTSRSIVTRILLNRPETLKAFTSMEANPGKIRKLVQSPRVTKFLDDDWEKEWTAGQHQVQKSIGDFVMKKRPKEFLELNRIIRADILARIMQYMAHRRSGDIDVGTIKEEIEAMIAQKLRADCSIIAHHFISPHPKALPDHEPEIRELVLLYKAYKEGK